jgi:alkylation response protein AidB-like acyl-CoA dehydrogenase
MNFLFLGGKRMEYFLTEEQEMIRDLARKITVERIVPVAAELDEKEEFPREIVKTIAEADLFGVYIPEEYGGLGMGVFEKCLIVEELSRGCAGVSVTLAASGLGTYPILLFGTEAQKQKYLPRLAAGEHIAAFALTEANAGSDAANIQTRAVEDGEDFILNGTKQWITNGGEAEVYVVIAMTDPGKGVRGATAFIVEKGTPGLSFGKKEKKMGIRASSTCEVIFEDCRVSRQQILGRKGTGFVVAMKTFDRTRPGVGAQAVGIAQGALDAALSFAREREQFGQTISSFQAIQHMLADMGTQIEAARGLVYNTARMIDGGAKEFSKESAMCKLFASDMAMKVTTDAVQIMGGSGYMRDYPVEKMMRDAKITQIYEGTNQIQRNVIALEMIKQQIGKAKK